MQSFPMYYEFMTTIPALRPSLITELIAESEALEERMAALQAGEGVEHDEVVKLRSVYRAWHARAKALLPPEAVKKFDEQRDGSIFSAGIAKFLADPRKESILRADDGSFPMGRWQYPFESIRGRLEEQRNLLTEALPEEAPAERVATDLAAVLRRLPEHLRVLQKRRPDWDISANITDERELQIVVEALLRTLFDDVRPEDYVSSHAGANARVDFVLPEVGVVVETKMARPSMSARKLGEELMIDAGRYPKHPNCDAVLAYVYDPHRCLDNPRGIEQDLTMRTAGGLSFVCVIS